MVKISVLSLKKLAAQAPWCLVWLLMMLFASSGISAEETVKNTATLSEYRLGSGDKISIRVYEESELSVDTVVSTSGVISYPFLGELTLGGRTVAEVEAVITQGLKGPYLVDPKVSVTILEYRQFYIHGEVKQSGGYPYQPDLTLRKAITLAGGFTERANKSKILVVREKDKKRGPVKIGLDDIIYPGDTVTVEESLF